MAFVLSVEKTMVPKLDFYRTWLQLSDKDVATLLTKCAPEPPACLLPLRQPGREP